MTEATAAVSPLRRRMIDDKSLATVAGRQRSYIQAVKRLSPFGHRPIDLVWRMSAPARFISYRRAFPGARSTDGVCFAVCGIRFDRAESRSGSSAYTA